MEYSSDTLNRLKSKLKTYINNPHLISEVIRNLGTEKNWKRMLDYLEYAYELGERLSPRRILVKSVFMGLHKAPSVLRGVRDALH